MFMDRNVIVSFKNSLNSEVLAELGFELELREVTYNHDRVNLVFSDGTKKGLFIDPSLSLSLDDMLYENLYLGEDLHASKDYISELIKNGKFNIAVFYLLDIHVNMASYSLALSLTYPKVSLIRHRIYTDLFYEDKMLKFAFLCYLKFIDENIIEFSKEVNLHEIVDDIFRATLLDLSSSDGFNEKIEKLEYGNVTLEDIPDVSYFHYLNDLSSVILSHNSMNFKIISGVTSNHICSDRYVLSNVSPKASVLAAFMNMSRVLSINFPHVQIEGVLYGEWEDDEDGSTSTLLDDILRCLK